MQISKNSRFHRWIMGVVIFSAAASLLFGIYTQTSAYQKGFSEYRDKQKYAAVFEWINKNTPKDSVIISREEDWFRIMITAYTHANIYDTNFNYFLIPFERLYHNFLVRMRLNGVDPKEIDGYMQKNQEEILGTLFNVGGLVAGKNYPPFLDVLGRLPADYREFMTKDFRKEIEKYKVDYITSEGSLPAKLEKELAPLHFTADKNGTFIYEFVKK